MSSFGERSQDRLNTCHTDLIVLFEEVIKTFDCAVICGFRGDVERIDKEGSVVHFGARRRYAE